MLNRIKNDLKKAMIEKNSTMKDTLRMILGEVPRLNKKANEQVTDTEIENIIRKLIKSEITVLEATGKDKKDSEYVSILESYLPSQMTSNEVSDWITNNVDMTKFNPKIKAMGFIMKSLKGKVDGNLVKVILTK